MIEIGLLGLGTVGSGVLDLVETNNTIITNRLGKKLNIKRILVKDLKKPRTSLARGKLTDNIKDILNDKEISIVIEVMGGRDPALSYMKEALERGKHVVTANKEVIAEFGQDLLSLARQNNVLLLFEASVAGGIPIIRPLQQCLSANEISKITAILNGTTNFILTQMAQSGESYDNALKRAQDEGFAEADPTDDVMGFDAARKLAILSTIAFNNEIIPSKIFTKGIDSLQAVDISEAKDRGYEIKLIAMAQRIKDKVAVSVEPMLLEQSHMLSRVDDVFNALLVEGNAVGPLMFYGKGAGKMATASAVIADVMNTAFQHYWHGSERFKGDSLEIIEAGSIISSFYIRLVGAGNGVSPDTIANRLEKRNIKVTDASISDDEDQITVIVSNTNRSNLEKVLGEIQEELNCMNIANIIRIEEGQF